MPQKVARRKGGPGKAYRAGLTILQLFKMFPDEASAREWFEGVRWAEGRYCGHCESENTKPVPNEKPMPYWCSDCKKYFSVKTGTPMHGSNLPLQKWVMALYLMATNLKGVSSMKMHRELGITQKTAWYMIHRIRQAWDIPITDLTGPVEVDETFIGGKEGNKHASKKIPGATGTLGKTPVVGMKDRETNTITAAPIANTDRATLQGFVKEHATPDAPVYTDEHSGYDGLLNHEVVKHSVKEYVKGQAHTNGIESFWAMLKRGYMGTYHKMSIKHLHRYVNEFAGRHNIRELDTLTQMSWLAASMSGKRLRYQDLTASNGPSAIAQS